MKTKACIFEIINSSLYETDLEQVTEAKASKETLGLKSSASVRGLNKRRGQLRNNSTSTKNKKSPPMKSQTVRCR